MATQKLKAEIKIIGINPYILLPGKVLTAIFKQAGKDKGPIPIKGTINAKPYTQTLVKFRGDWRLYVNTKMLNNSPKRVGEIINILVEFDPVKRIIPHHPKFTKSLNENRKARVIFKNLRPSLQAEIVKYLSSLKSEESIDRNVTRAISFLLGNARFIGKDKP